MAQHWARKTGPAWSRVAPCTTTTARKGHWQALGKSRGVESVLTTLLITSFAMKTTAAVLLLCLAAACGLAAAEGGATGNTTARLRFSNPLTLGAPANAAEAGPGTPLAGLRGCC